MALVLRRQFASKFAVAVSAVAVLVSTFMPWLQSGERRRSSYELVGIARRLQAVPTEAMRAATFWWPVVPLLVVASSLLVLWDRPRLGMVAGAIAALYVGAFAVVFWRLDIPPLGGVQLGVTVVVAALASLALAASLVLNLVLCSQPSVTTADHG